MEKDCAIAVAPACVDCEILPPSRWLIHNHRHHHALKWGAEGRRKRGFPLYERETERDEKPTSDSWWLENLFFYWGGGGQAVSGGRR